MIRDRVSFILMTTTVTSGSADNLQLQAGIAALKGGHRAEARDLLLRVVDVEENNETAWLWLSGAVDSMEERRICLENVLALNPENRAARRGLAKLAVQEREMEEEEDTAVAPFVTSSKYNDIWEQDGDICAYCARELSPENTHCPACGRKLLVSTYRYDQPSANLHILWVLLIGISQLYMLQALYDVIVRRSIVFAILPGLMMGLFIMLAGGVYFRQFWAYATAVAVLIIVLVINILGYFVPTELTLATIMPVGPMFDGVISPLLGGLADFLHIFQLMAVGLALFIAVLKAGPDFERVQHRQTAVVQKGVQEAARYHAIALKAAKRGEWATAVLHWQRAAANAPGQISFQRHLGSAYARLGFYQRSADVLSAALHRTTDPAQRQQMEKLLTAVTAQLNPSTKETNHVER
mgnify:CR=1 FL=1